MAFSAILLASKRIIYFNYALTSYHVTATSKTENGTVVADSKTDIHYSKIHYPKNTIAMKTFSDIHLIHLFQNGNNEALEVLVNRHKDKIFTSIYIFTKDTYLAEDLFQEVFIKIIDTFRSNRYNDEGKFLPWALRVAHNFCVDHYRKVKRKPAITTADDEEIFYGLKEMEETTDKKMVKNDKHEQVRQVLNMLPPEQREVIVLRHYAYMNFKEIAQLTGCSVNTALGRMRYGLQNMRSIITGKQIAL